MKPCNYHSEKALDRAGYDVDRVSNENRFRRLVLITGHRRENFGKGGSRFVMQ